MDISKLLKATKKMIFKQNFIKALNELEKEEWITVKGNHIKIGKGQTKEEAIKEFIEDKQTGGYSERNKSNRAISAELRGLDNITTLSKKLNISSKELSDLYSDEWHHTNKNYTKTNYYYTQAYLDLKEKGKIETSTIEKYDLNKMQISGIKESWENLQKKIKSDNPEDILNDYKKIFRNPLLHNKIDEALSRKKKVDFSVSSIRELLNELRKNPTKENKESLEKNLKFLDERLR